MRRNSLMVLESYWRFLAGNVIFSAQCLVSPAVCSASMSYGNHLLCVRLCKKK